MTARTEQQPTPNHGAAGERPAEQAERGQSMTARTEQQQAAPQEGTA